MPNPSETLLNAILADDRPQVRELLKNNPQLASQPVTKARLASELPHWI